MTREEFSTIVKAMKAIYSNPGFIADQDAFNVWYALFASDDYAVTQAAVQKHMLTKSTPPTPADIKGNMVDLGNSYVNEEKAWQMVVKAVGNSGYHADEEFDLLPKIVQRAVATPANLRIMATMDRDELHTVEKSHFMRVYRREVESAREEARIPESIRNLIASTNRQMIGGAS